MPHRGRIHKVGDKITLISKVYLAARVGEFTFGVEYVVTQVRKFGAIEHIKFKDAVGWYPSVWWEPVEVQPSATNSN